MLCTIHMMRMVLLGNADNGFKYEKRLWSIRSSHMLQAHLVIGQTDPYINNSSFYSLRVAEGLHKPMLTLQPFPTTSRHL